MSYRTMLVTLALALAFGVANVVSAATMTITGSVVASATPTGQNLYLVVRVFNNASVEIGRIRQPLPSSTNNTYPFQFSINSSGASTIQAYIVHPDPSNITDYILFKSTEVSYTPGIVLPVQGVGGTEILPRTSAGTLLLLEGILAAILAGGVALWRRQRSRILTRHFA